MWAVDVAHGGVGSVPGEESGVDPGEVGHITPAVNVPGLDVVPVPGIQVGQRSFSMPAWSPNRVPPVHMVLSLNGSWLCQRTNS